MGLSYSLHLTTLINHITVVISHISANYDAECDNFLPTNIGCELDN